ncbi:MAG TPA: hypothetical protein VF629_11975 [Hymenobacter sp.]|jgi:hypothetical protein|uniref:hypothetical protein n=1 Tax=Hymenobacter sp. TaxID=1898978 RepID=UPI002EDB7BA0
MRKFLPLFLLATAPAWAQTTVSPVIDRTDMPAPSAAAPVDTLRLSVASPALPGAAPALSQRGANQTWNYTSLTPLNQRVEQFVLVSSFAGTAPLYALTFGALGGANRATTAAPQALPLPLPAGVPITLTDTYQFFNTSAPGAATQDFRSVGYGGTLSATAVPATYASQAQQDVIYRFPLSFASLADSSESFFSTPAALGAVAYLSQKRKRVNVADAWGSLITPFGTFNTVRVVSKLSDHDSVSIGGMPGVGFDLPLTREYKWLAKGVHVPLLTIVTQVVAGRETVTSVQYRDSYRRLGPLAARDAATNAVLAAYPNPSAAGSPLVLTVPASSGPLAVSATDLVGRELFRRSFRTSAAGTIALDAEAFGRFRGVALLTVTTSHGTATRRVVRE